MWGANDIESWSGAQSPSATYNWYDGYTGNSGPSFADFGSADGCPESGFGSCEGGWQQGDYYNLSWGFSSAFPAPEIYYTGLANQWYWISYAGQGVHGAIQPLGPLDDCDLQSGTNCPAQAWSQLNQFFYSPAMDFSIEMYDVS